MTGSFPRTPAQSTVHQSTHQGIHSALADDAVVPLGTAADNLDRLAALFRTIAGLTNQQVNSGLMLDIRRLAELGDRVARDVGSFVDFARDRMEDVHLPEILAVVKGACK